MKKPWFTIRDAYDGIETFLLNGQQDMLNILTMAREHGSTDFDTIGFLRALVAADRLEVISRPFSPPNPGGDIYRLTDSTLNALKADIGRSHAS